LGQYNLGVCFAQGKGIEDDEKEAVYWCAHILRFLQRFCALHQTLLSSDLCSHANDCTNRSGRCWWLSLMFVCIHRWQKAADQNCAEAMYALGMAYTTGIGVERDEV
jgi:TPR repeat protein